MVQFINVMRWWTIDILYFVFPVKVIELFIEKLQVEYKLNCTLIDSLGLHFNDCGCWRIAVSPTVNSQNWTIFYKHRVGIPFKKQLTFFPQTTAVPFLFNIIREMVDISSSQMPQASFTIPGVNLPTGFPQCQFLSEVSGHPDSLLKRRRQKKPPETPARCCVRSPQI